jgi:cell division protein FtsQ
MWDNPTALNGLTRLILAVTVLFALWMAGRQAVVSWLPIRQVEVSGAVHPETLKSVRSALSGLSGDLMTVDLEAAQRGLEALPWVRTATVRRVWPDSLAITVEEHVPAAAWNDLAVMDVRGDVFPVTPWKSLPRIYAQEGMEKDVAQRYAEFSALLGGAGWRIADIHVDARYAWVLTLSDGLTIDLGRERLKERLKRFVTFYPLAAEKLAGISRVDMRYPNGFAAKGGVPQRSPNEKQRT